MTNLDMAWGRKGGVGKTFVAHATANHYHAAGRNPIIVDGDTENPDFYRPYKEELECHLLDLDVDKGWEALVDLVDKAGDRPVVVNTGARNKKCLAKYGDVLNDLEGVDVTIFFVINTERDSLVLLKAFADIVRTKLCVVKNGFWGEPEDFSLFAESSFANAPSVYFPRATDSVRQMMYSSRVPMHLLAEKMTLGQRKLAQTWMRQVDACIVEALEKAAVVNG